MKPKAMTLLELLVVMGLAALLGTLLVQLLLPAFRASGRYTARASLNAEGMMAVSGMASDLQRSAPEGISVLAGDPAVLALVPLEGVSGQGLTVWDDGLVAYAWSSASRRLVRLTAPPVPPGLSLTFNPGRPPRLTPDQLENLGTAAGKVLTSDVAAFEVKSPGAGPALGQPVTLRLLLERTARGERTACEVVRTVYLRNQGRF